jgi:hypothetical protein
LYGGDTRGVTGQVVPADHSEDMAVIASLFAKAGANCRLDTWCEARLDDKLYASANPIVVILAGAAWTFPATPILGGTLIICALGLHNHRFVSRRGCPA